MSIYQIFAENLRAECQRFKSIAEVCRLSGINRQQFNKYLGGQSLPNATTLRKICKVLGIAEVALFKDRTNQSHSDDANAARLTEVVPAPINKFAHLKDLFTSASTIARSEGLAMNLDEFDGYYCVYFPMLGSKDHVMVAFLKITTLNGVSYFTRHSYLTGKTVGKRRFAIGRHTGIVTTNQKEVYLIGVDSAIRNQLSFLTFDRVPMAGGQIHAGLGIIYGFVHPGACRLCVESIGKTFAQAKRASIRLGVLPLDDPSIHPFVASALTAGLDNTSFLSNNRVLDKLAQLSTQ